MSYRYPIATLTWGEEEIAAAHACLVERQTTMGKRVAQFEELFQDYLGCSDAVMVNSGSSADLVMMLAAVEAGYLKPGDEVLVPAVTWPTQAWAAILAGLSVKLVDVRPSTLNTSVELLKAAITPRTRGIFVVHLMGNPCDMPAILALAQKRDMKVFEDCCEALGARSGDRQVGTFGIAGAFSFFQSHHITTMEGGMISTSDPGFADACRSIRAHGWIRDLKDKSGAEVIQKYLGGNRDPRYLFLGMGFNFRPLELNAAFGLCQLPKIAQFNDGRARNAEAVTAGFRLTNGSIVETLLPTHFLGHPAWFSLPFVLREGLPYSREDVTAYLERYGYETRPMVGGNLARQPAFQRVLRTDILPGADAIHDRGFYLGLPQIERNMTDVVTILNGFDSHLRLGSQPIHKAAMSA